MAETEAQKQARLDSVQRGLDNLPVLGDKIREKAQTEIDRQRKS